MYPYLIHFNMLQLISLLYLLVTVTCAGLSPSHDEECSALFQFKQSLHHQDYALCDASWFQTFRSWKLPSNASNAGFNCCAWYGVECSSNDDADGHVVGVDLSESFLCGHINSSTTLFSLVHLQKLNLAMNYFYESQIPSDIAHLKQLRSLNLSYSGFSGQIPNEISHLTQLSSLDLSWNPLKLHNPSLENLLQNLTQLQELDLSRVDISSSVPLFLANFSSLRSLRLGNCLLQDEFPKAILELPKLKYIGLAGNTNLSGSIPKFYNNSLLEHVNLASTGFFGMVPESISNLRRLTFLRLSDCSFSGPIPRSLSNLTQLTYLGLGDNKFTGFVPSVLVSLSEIIVLELYGNEFKNGQFPEWLGKLTKLSELYVFSMNISTEIPHFLANQTKLSVVDMGRNSLIGHIPSSLFNLTQLTVLNLEHNQLQGLMSRSFSNFKSLQELNLRDNNFSGKVDLDIFLGLDKLNTLMLGNNKISLVTANNYTNSTLPVLEDLTLPECNLKEFPSFLRFQHKLTFLLLGGNAIEGLVPVWIWNNSQETLQLVDLSNNFITGFEQQPHFLQWGSLQALYIRNNQIQGQLPIPSQATIIYDVSYNKLTGEIPPSICEVKSLRSLDLSSNYMSGTLPPCLGSLSNSLRVLNLRKNNFHGVMMNAFMHGSMLRSIDLSENGFTGQLPRSLTNSTDLEVLSLGDNSFDDIFPSWLGTLPKLQVLILRSNKLYGQIQGSTTVLSQFPKLRIIDLSNNSFSGHLHRNFFQSWNSMKLLYDGQSSVMETWMYFGSFETYNLYSMTITHKGVRTRYPKILTIFTAIDLSCNQFVGEIPQSIKDLRGLGSLNISNNQFSGRVLPSLGYLKELESLDLSQNKLSGEIPQELVQLNFLSIFNVSFNNLDGHIPRGQQFNTFEKDSYEGNPRLCGKPLPQECQGSKASILPPTSNMYGFESFLPSEKLDWIIIFCGVGIGLIVGIVNGNWLYEIYSDRFTKRKPRWVTPLRNTRRS